MGGDPRAGGRTDPGDGPWPGDLRRAGLAWRHRIGATPLRSAYASPRMRRLLRDISLVLIISGLLLLADAGVTLLWQEPLTAVIALIERSQIDKRFLSYRAAPLPQLDRRALAAINRSASGSPSWRGKSNGRSRPATRSARWTSEHRHQLHGRAGNRRGHPRKGSRPLPPDRLPGHGSDGRDRRPSHHLPGTVPPSRRRQARCQDHSDDALRTTSPTRSNTAGSSIRPLGGSRATSATSGLCCRRATRCTAPSQRIVVFARLTGLQPLGPALL